MMAHLGVLTLYYLQKLNIKSLVVLDPKSTTTYFALPYYVPALKGFLVHCHLVMNMNNFAKYCSDVSYV